MVYNNARVALSLRGRELASLRVLGFTREEISAVLIGELGVQVLIGIPLGLLFGTAAGARHAVQPTTRRPFAFPVASGTTPTPSPRW